MKIIRYLTDFTGIRKFFENDFLWVAGIIAFSFFGILKFRWEPMHTFFFIASKINIFITIAFVVSIILFWRNHIVDNKIPKAFVIARILLLLRFFASILLLGSIVFVGDAAGVQLSNYVYENQYGIMITSVISLILYKMFTEMSLLKTEKRSFDYYKIPFIVIILFYVFDFSLGLAIVFFKIKNIN